jgi:hypothetical protein
MPSRAFHLVGVNLGHSRHPVDDLPRIERVENDGLFSHDD